MRHKLYDAPTLSKQSTTTTTVYEMHSPTQSHHIIVHTVCDSSGVLHADTRELTQLLTTTSQTTSIVAAIERDVPCVLAYAAALYGLLVDLDQPTRNLVLRLRISNATSSTSIMPITRIECTTAGCVHSAGAVAAHNSVAVGGTFDRLHAGHRLLLTVAGWAAREKVYVGVTSAAMLQHKQYRELIEAYYKRAGNAVRFIRAVNPSLSTVQSSELQDGAGIAGSLPELNALVATLETRKGAIAVNEQRIERGLRPLSLIVVHLLFASRMKLSSTALREADAQKENAS